MTGAELLAISPVLPVVVLDDAADAVPVAEALLAGGVGVLELTLRTPVALDAIASVAADVPDIVVGAGTVLTPAQARQAADYGASFLVTPGFTDTLLPAALGTGLPVLPGVSTVSEAMRAAEQSVNVLKFFPAEASGGARALRAFAGPLPHLTFCPTGGISAETARDYLELPNVGCVGGSWLTPADAVAARDFDRITALAQAVSSWGQPPGPHS